MTQVAGPDGVCSLAPAQLHANGDLALLHDTLTIGFLVGGVSPSTLSHADIVQIQVDAVWVQVFNAGITHGGQNAA